VPAFLFREEAQATSEYILILSIVIAMFMVAIKKLLLPAIKALGPAVTSAFQERLFKKGGFHHLRLSR
jgi:hypothetical protein